MPMCCNEREQSSVQIVEHGILQVLTSLKQRLSANGTHELGLHAVPGTAQNPADQRYKIEDATAAEASGIREMTRAQRVRMQVGNELAQYRDNPS